MKLEINIEKKHLYLLFVLCAVILGIIVVNAVPVTKPVAQGAGHHQTLYVTKIESAEVETTTGLDVPIGIEDNLYLMGTFGIGTSSPQERFSIHGSDEPLNAETGPRGCR